MTEGKIFSNYLKNKIKDAMNRGPVSQFIEHHYRHFNAAALVDAAKAYEDQLAKGNKMMITLAGAMSTAELGLSLAEMIRQDKVHIITCTGANLEEDVFNLVAHDHYKRIPNYRDLSFTKHGKMLSKMESECYHMSTSTKYSLVESLKVSIK